MKDEANQIVTEFGLSKLDFRKTSENKRSAEETHIMLKGGTSLKGDLREVIEEAKKVSSTQNKYISHLKLYGVTVTRSKTEYSFLHSEKQRELSTSLLKKALAISNEKCNGLIEKQNALVEKLRSDLAAKEYSLQAEVRTAVRKMDSVTEKFENMNGKIYGQVSTTISHSTDKMKNEVVQDVKTLYRVLRTK